MSINSALSCPQTIGGVIGLSGHVFPAMQKIIDEDKEDVFKDKKENLRFFLYHGKEDDLLEYGRCAKTYENLIASGFKNAIFKSEEFLGHSVSPKETKEIAEFLASVMK
jgi:predicted esterase